MYENQKCRIVNAMSHIYMRFAHNIDFNINFSHNCALNVKAQIYSLEQQGLIM